MQLWKCLYNLPAFNSTGWMVMSTRWTTQYWSRITTTFTLIEPLLFPLLQNCELSDIVCWLVLSSELPKCHMLLFGHPGACRHCLPIMQVLLCVCLAKCCAAIKKCTLILSAEIHLGRHLSDSISSFLSGPGKSLAEGEEEKCFESRFCAAIFDLCVWERAVSQHQKSSRANGN